MIHRDTRLPLNLRLLDFHRDSTTRTARLRFTRQKHKGKFRSRPDVSQPNCRNFPRKISHPASLMPR